MTAQTTETRPPTLLLRLVLVLAVVTLASALVGAYAGFAEQNYFLAGLETILIVCCVVGVFTGLGRHDSGPAVAIASLAGAVGVCSVLGYLSITGPVLGVSARPVLGGRLLVAALLGAIAGLVMLLRRPGVSFPLLVKGALLSAPPVAAVGAYVGSGAVRSLIGGLHPVVLAVAGSTALLVLMGLLAVGAHCIVRAFEVGLEAGGRGGEGGERAGAA